MILKLGLLVYVLGNGQVEKIIVLGFCAVAYYLYVFHRLL